MKEIIKCIIVILIAIIRFASTACPTQFFFDGFDESLYRPTDLDYDGCIPQGRYLNYTGFTYLKVGNHTGQRLPSPSLPNVIVTSPQVQSATGFQPTLIRHSSAISFDLLYARFACSFWPHRESNDNTTASCLVTFVCQPNDHSHPERTFTTPTQSQVRRTFSYPPKPGSQNVTTDNPIFIPTGFARADFSVEFTDLDFCYVTLEQTAEAPTHDEDTTVILMLDNVYGRANATNCTSNQM